MAESEETMEKYYEVQTTKGDMVAKLYAISAASAVSKVKDLYPWYKNSRLVAVEVKEQRGK